MNLLKDRVAVVTGASRGIGLATSLAFAKNGATLIMVGRDKNALDGARSEILTAVPTAEITINATDISDPVAVSSLFSSVFKQYKRLDVLVANAGVLEDALIGMVTPGLVDRVFGTNTFGVIYCNQYASRLMARSGGGSIINVSSIIGINGNVGQAVYGGSKAAVIGITKSLAKELAGQRIRVNAVAPGFIDTPMARSISKEKFQERLDSIGMKRIGTPEEVAEVITFLACDMSRYVTGQTIGVDGGMLI